MEIPYIAFKFQTRQSVNFNTLWLFLLVSLNEISLYSSLKNIRFFKEKIQKFISKFIFLFKQCICIILPVIRNLEHSNILYTNLLK